MIVVTGLGAVSAAGVGRGPLAEAVARGEPRTVAIDLSQGIHGEGAARTAALIDQREVARLIPPLAARRMSAPSRYAIVAARTALQDAGVEIGGFPDPDFAVVASTALGPSSFTQRLVDQILDEGPAMASPALFSECVANAPAAQVALACRARGPNLTIAQSEAGPLRAVARGAAEVLGGRARLALAGSVDEMIPLVHAILDRFRSLARPAPGRPERARPFDRGRDGFLAAEGATFLVLETEESALGRDARPLARLRGGWSAFDPSAPASGWGRGAEALARALGRGLERCGLTPPEVDLIVSGASGSIAGDRLEADVLRRVWDGPSLPPVVAPKATTGEYGAFLGAALLAAAGAPVGPTAGFEEIDPELRIVPHAGGGLGDVRHVLVTTLAAGGAASWLVLERP